MDKIEALTRVGLRSGATTRNTHFANVNCAKDVWWIEIPLLKIESGLAEVHLLLFDARSNELHHLRVPSRFLIDNLDDLDVREDKGLLALQLAIDSPDKFRNTRPIQSKVSLADFLVGTF